MTDAPFRYDEGLVERCATSSYAADVLSAPSSTNAAAEAMRGALPSPGSVGASSACEELFDLHSSHYGRDRHNSVDALRLERFVTNVAFVHGHNTNFDDGDEGPGWVRPRDETPPLHRVALNQFSDLFVRELPLAPVAHASDAAAAIDFPGGDLFSDGGRLPPELGSVRPLLKDEYADDAAVSGGILPAASRRPDAVDWVGDDYFDEDGDFDDDGGSWDDDLTDASYPSGDGDGDGSSDGNASSDVPVLTEVELRGGPDAAGLWGMWHKLIDDRTFGHHSHPHTKKGKKKKRKHHHKGGRYRPPRKVSIDDPRGRKKDRSRPDIESSSDGGGAPHGDAAARAARAARRNPGDSDLIDPFLQGIAVDADRSRIRDGKEVWLGQGVEGRGRGHGHHHHHHKRTSDDDGVDADGLDSADDDYDVGGGGGIGNRYGGDAGDAFTSSLNWATEENPDGVGVVNPPMDQGACGSCWAFAATGSLEASIARRAAFDAFAAAIRDNLKLLNLRDIRDAAVAAAADAERDALRRAVLSVQELVDCDTRGDQGCNGGNPLLAFFFIHKYGLTTSALYPYVGTEQVCRVDLVEKPVATVQSWGVLTPNFEDNMELVLRYIGPIAVGVNGGDPSFMAYRGGIFNSTTCGQDANHAMLIVGYGEEETPGGETVKYWIARNSWGLGWGEQGYVRVARTDGERDRESVCGIAQNPSVALGGTLIAKAAAAAARARRGGADAIADDGAPEVMGSLRLSCAKLGFGDDSFCVRLLGGFRSILVCVALLLAAVVMVQLLVQRRRKRPRRLRQPHRSIDADDIRRDRDLIAGDETCLLIDEKPCASYGSSSG